MSADMVNGGLNRKTGRDFAIDEFEAYSKLGAPV